VRSDTPGAGRVRCAGIGTRGDTGDTCDTCDTVDVIEGVSESFEKDGLEECADEEENGGVYEGDAIFVLAADLNVLDLDLPHGTNTEKVTRGSGRWRRGGAFITWK